MNSPGRLAGVGVLPDVTIILVLCGTGVSGRSLWPPLGGGVLVLVFGGLGDPLVLDLVAALSSCCLAAFLRSRFRFADSRFSAVPLFRGSTSPLEFLRLLAGDPVAEFGRR